MLGIDFSDFMELEQRYFGAIGLLVMAQAMRWDGMA